MGIIVYLMRKNPIAILTVPNQGLVGGLMRYDEIVAQSNPMVPIPRPSKLALSQVVGLRWTLEPANRLKRRMLTY